MNEFAQSIHQKDGKEFRPEIRDQGSQRCWKAFRRKQGLGSALSRALALWTSLGLLWPGLSWATENHPKSPTIVNEFKIHGAPFRISAEAGQVTSHYQGRSGFTVVCLQDLHCNYEAQSGIAGILEELAGKFNLRLIGVEGNSRSVDVTPLAEIPLPAIRDRVGRYFMRRGLVTGAEYQAAVGRKPLNLEGIETQSLYDANKKDLLLFLNEESQGYCEELRDALDRLKQPIYTPTLAKLDHESEQFDQERISLENYADYLLSEAGRQNVSTAPYSLLKRFIEGQRLDKSELFDSDTVLGEAEQLGRALREKLYTHPEQKALDRQIQWFAILEHMVNISARDGEVAYYREHHGEYGMAATLKFLKEAYYRHAMNLELDPEIAKLDEFLKAAANFYDRADQRSDAFVRNLIQLMQARHESLAAMISGGFHAGRVEAALRAREISYVAIKPRILRTDAPNPYFSLLRDQPNPLRQLLAKNTDLFGLASFFGDPSLKRYIKLVAALEAQVTDKFQRPLLEAVRNLPADRREAALRYFNRENWRVKAGPERMLVEAGGAVLLIQKDGTERYSPPGAKELFGAEQLEPGEGEGAYVVFFFDPRDLRLEDPEAVRAYLGLPSGSGGGGALGRWLGDNWTSLSWPQKTGAWLRRIWAPVNLGGSTVAGAPYSSRLGKDAWKRYSLPEDLLAKTYEWLTGFGYEMMGSEFENAVDAVFEQIQRPEFLARYGNYLGKKLNPVTLGSLIMTDLQARELPFGEETPGQAVKNYLENRAEADRLANEILEQPRNADLNRLRPGAGYSPLAALVRALKGDPSLAEYTIEIDPLHVAADLSVSGRQVEAMKVLAGIRGVALKMGGIPDALAVVKIRPNQEQFARLMVSRAETAVALGIKLAPGLGSWREKMLGELEADAKRGVPREKLEARAALFLIGLLRELSAAEPESGEARNIFGLLERVSRVRMKGKPIWDLYARYSLTTRQGKVFAGVLLPYSYAAPGRVINGALFEMIRGYFPNIKDKNNKPLDLRPKRPLSSNTSA